MISNLNRTNIVFDKDNSFQIKSPILGLVHFVGNADGNIIRNNVARTYLKRIKLKIFHRQKAMRKWVVLQIYQRQKSVANNGVSGDVGSEEDDEG
jgi:hypothetical protein